MMCFAPSSKTDPTMLIADVSLPMQTVALRIGQYPL